MTMTLVQMADELLAIIEGDRPRLNKTEMREYVQDLLAANAARLTQPAQSVDVWQPIETAPKAKSVLVAYVNECGKSRVVRACFIARFTELSDEDTNNEINPADENCYTIEGWYEQIDNWDEYSGIRIHHEVTHWTPLPGAPTLTAALQEKSNG